MGNCLLCQLQFYHFRAGVRFVIYSKRRAFLTRYIIYCSAHRSSSAVCLFTNVSTSRRRHVHVRLCSSGDSKENQGNREDIESSLRRGANLRTPFSPHQIERLRQTKNGVLTLMANGQCFIINSTQQKLFSILFYIYN